NPSAPHVWRPDPRPRYGGPPPQAGEQSASSPRLENRPPPRLRRYSPPSGGEIHAAPRLENRPPPRLRRYSPTSGGEIHADLRAPPRGPPQPTDRPRRWPGGPRPRDPSP